MTSSLLDIDHEQGVLVPVWKYRFDIGSGAWECPALKGTADLIRSRNGTAYERTEQHVPLSRINAHGEYLPLEANHLGGALATNAVARAEAEIAADRQKRER